MKKSRTPSNGQRLPSSAKNEHIFPKIWVKNTLIRALVDPTSNLPTSLFVRWPFAVDQPSKFERKTSIAAVAALRQLHWSEPRPPCMSGRTFTYELSVSDPTRLVRTHDRLQRKAQTPQTKQIRSLTFFFSLSLSVHQKKMQLTSCPSFLRAQHCTCRRFRHPISCCERRHVAKCATRRRIAVESVSDSTVSRMRRRSCFLPTTSSIVCGIAWRHKNEELSGEEGGRGSLCAEPLEQRLQAMQRALQTPAGALVPSDSRTFLPQFAQGVHSLRVFVSTVGP